MAKVITESSNYTAIADAIRAKTGGTTQYKPSEMPDGVDEVFAAGVQSEYDRFWDAFQQNGNRTNYAYAFAGAAWTQEQLEQIKYPITFIAETGDYQCWTKGIFAYLNWGGTSRIDMTNILTKMDFSNCQRVYNTFMNAYVENISLDLSNCDNIVELFNGADSGGKCCENVTLKVSEKCVSYDRAFHYCTNLTEIRFADGSVIAATISFQRSTRLTKASITSIVNALASATSGLSITLSNTAVNSAFTTAEWSALAGTKSNWTINLI